MRVVRLLIVLVAGSVSAFGMDITPKEAVEKVKRGAKLINALPHNISERYKLPGAININYRDDNLLAKLRKSGIYKTTPVVAYCLSDFNSRKLVEFMRKNGFTNSFYSKGGYAALKEALLREKIKKN